MKTDKAKIARSKSDITLTEGQHKYYGKVNRDMNVCKNQIKSLFQSAKVNHYTIDAICANMNFVRDRKEYKALPALYRREIEGYYFGIFDYFMTVELIFVHWYDGEYIGKKDTDREAVNAMYKNSFNQSKIYSAHVYKGSQDIFQP